MSLNTKHSYKVSVERARRRRRRPRRSIPSLCSGSGGCKARGSFRHSKERKSRLSEKMEALKKLIPTQNGKIVKSDQLFQETADYIVLLRTRVVILQKLIEYYGNTSENEIAVL